MTFFKFLKNCASVVRSIVDTVKNFFLEPHVAHRTTNHAATEMTSAPRPEAIMPINIRYRSKENRPREINQLFSDYIYGRIPSLNDLKNRMQTVYQTQNNWIKYRR
jgi:hypothetical protein